MKQADSPRPVDSPWDPGRPWPTPDAILDDAVRAVEGLAAIRAGIAQQDPLVCAGGILRIIALGEEHADQLRALREAMFPSHTEDWECPGCCELVPKTFDLCWNCSTLHPELDDGGLPDQDVIPPASAGRSVPEPVLNGPSESM